MDSVRVDIIQERLNRGIHNVGHDNHNPDQAIYDVRILLDEVYQRDILISDLLEQRVGWKEDVEYYRNLLYKEKEKNKSPIQKASDAISAISDYEYSQGIDKRYEMEQYFKKVIEEWKEDGKQEGNVTQD